MPFESPVHGPAKENPKQRDGGTMSNRNASVLLYLAIVAAVAVLLHVTAYAQQVRTFSDGVGKEGRVAIKDYSLLLTFAELAGPYKADISVTIYDSGGEIIVNEGSAGPWFYADLPPGNYRVVAADPNGDGQSASFDLEGRKQKIVRLVWR